VISLSDVPLYSRLLALPTNIRLGWRGLPGTNALAYYEKAILTAVKTFYNIGPIPGKNRNILIKICPKYYMASNHK